MRMSKKINGRGLLFLLKRTIKGVFFKTPPMLQVIKGVLSPMLHIIKGVFYISLYKYGFKGLFVRMPSSKRKLRQFNKNAFNKTSSIKRHVVMSSAPSRAAGGGSANLYRPQKEDT